MAVSDGDKSLLQLATDYYFVNEKEIPVSFTVVPFCSDDGKSCATARTRVFLHGVANGGLRKVYKEVTSWSLGLQEAQPELFVHSIENTWLKLGTPSRSYRDRFRSIMITIKWLHCLRRKPEATEKAIWDYLQKVFRFVIVVSFILFIVVSSAVVRVHCMCSSLERRPSKNDLAKHVHLIKIIAKRDKVLARAKVCFSYILIIMSKI